MSLALASRRAAISPSWVKSPLWRTARAVPSLDLPFADTKSLTDAVTGQSLVTFTRASSGTYVGSDRLLKTATTNLLLRSEEFDNASWTKITATVTSNVATAPSGTVTADKLIVDNGQSAGYASQTISFVSGTSYTASCYAKAGEVSDFRFVFESGAFGSNLNAIFNLNTGVVSSFTAASASIQSVGNGWYRCVATALATATASAGVQFRSVHAGNGTNGIFFWGAQLEQSSTVGEYIPTTSTINSAPRFDHNPTTGESLGLLVEEQRTNLLLRSEEFDSASWPKQNITATSNQTTAPDGSANADLISGNAGTATKYIYQSYAAATSGTFTFSVFAKAGTESFIVVRITDQGGVNEVRQRFDLSSGVLSGSAAVNGTVTAASSSINPVGNGWYRCVVTATFAAFTQLQGNVWLNSYAAVSLTTNFYLWGAQLEAGAFPTSYIPTTGAAATRSADVASITGTNFSSWYRVDEGSLFTDCSINYTVPGTAFPLGASLNDGTSNNRIENGFLTASLAGFEVTASGVAQVAMYPNAGSTLTRRLTTSFRLNDFAVSVNGGTVNTDTSGTVPTVDRLRIGERTVGNTLNGTIRRLTFWPARLPNSTIQALTQ